MARLMLAALLLCGSLFAQKDAGSQFKESGVCARCHVISVIEWGISKHRPAGTSCTGCHGVSEGHVIDERNNIKPERIPRANAIAGLCSTCHDAGCPKTARKDSCQQCHHAHALLDPNKPAVAKDALLERLTAQWNEATRHRTEGERLFKLGQWEKARAEFLAVLQSKPDDVIATQRLMVCEHRLKPSIPGFEVSGMDWDPRTGLPREVKVAGLDIPMVLVSGGDSDLGSDDFLNAKPMHSVVVKPFYLAKFEFTQAEWKTLMGDNPSVNKGDRLPVEHVSWEDAQALVKKLNDRVPGAGFRLPTEAEWEMAARAGEPPTTAALPKYAWFGQSGRSAAARVVGAGAPNKLGLFDMQGNVWEWCSTLYQPYPYNPADGRESPAAAGLRVLRGGGFTDSATLLDAGFRHGERADRRLRWNGLRIARSVPGN